MPIQDIYEIEPNTAEQADALKAFAKALKMRIERKDKPYNAEFVAKIKKSQQQAKEVGNKAILNKIFALMNELENHPTSGTGKPEMLKHHLAGLWSRRINKEHRMIYEIQTEIVLIHSAFGHY